MDLFLCPGNEQCLLSFSEKLKMFICERRSPGKRQAFGPSLEQQLSPARHLRTQEGSLSPVLSLCFFMSNQERSVEKVL